MSFTATVSVVIPAWNLWDMTRACLESLAEHTPPGMLEVVVVDNGSTDATATELEPLGRSLFGDLFRAERFEENRGFAVASNAGACLARADRVLFLNNDTLALPGWLPPLLEALDSAPAGEPALAAVGPMLLFEGGDRIQHCGVAFSLNGVQHVFAHFPSDHPAVVHPRDFQALTAAALLMPRSEFIEAGMFCESYCNGFEDMDLCWRLGKNGRRLRLEPKSRMIHRESQTPGRKQHDAANARLFSERCPGGMKPDIYRIAHENGFGVRLTEVLDTCLCQSPGHDASLEREHGQERDPDALWRLLRVHPLWRGGYDRLAHLLEAENRHEDQLYVRALACNFFPDMAAYMALSRSARLAANPSLMQEAATCLERHSGRMADREGLRARARALSRAARSLGDPGVEAMYLDFLERLDRLPAQ